MDLAAFGIENCTWISQCPNRIHNSLAIPEFVGNPGASKFFDGRAHLVRQLMGIAHLKSTVEFEFHVEVEAGRELSQALRIIDGEVINSFIKPLISTPDHVAAVSYTH